MLKHRGAMLRGVVERHPLGKMCVRRGCRSQAEQRCPQGTVRCYEHGSVPDLLRQRQELLAQGKRCLIRDTSEIIMPETTQYREKPLWIFQGLTELPSTAVGLF